MPVGRFKVQEAYMLWIRVSYASVADLVSSWRARPTFGIVILSHGHVSRALPPQFPLATLMGRRLGAYGFDPHSISFSFTLIPPADCQHATGRQLYFLRDLND
ncbi:hypothetical protein D9613_012780 [Agrocybe pediades]|uniref:Uncharacterized protein n=1 Tax=Agrocybe pediades TaxID=84607 RepID=A0A8H4R3D9_9AGAR|nr:hypothetical protein D9613_012780 [Agrocybe pediades]